MVIFFVGVLSFEEHLKISDLLRYYRDLSSSDRPNFR